MNTMSHYSILLIAASSLSLQAMNFFEPLNTIERHLVLKTIHQRGLTSVLSEIRNTKPPKAINDGLRCGYHISTALAIETTFHKNDADPLAKSIFNEIEKIERKSGYIPAHIQKATNNTFSVTMPTNFLGLNTRYYWLEENGNRIPAVRVEARLTNQRALLEIVESYTE